MLFLYLLATIANRAIALISILVLSYLLPLNEFGRYAIGATNALLMQVLFGAWLSASANRLVATAGQLRQDLISTTAIAVAGIALAATLLAAGNALLPKPFADPLFFALVLAWALAIIIYDVTLNVLNGLGQPRAYAGLSFSRNLLSLAAASGAALMGWGAEGALAGQILGTLLPPLIEPAARRSWAQARLAAASPALLRRKLTVGAGGTLYLSLSVLLSFSGRNLASAFFGKAAAGHWALATDIFYGPVAIVGSSWALAMMPELYRLRDRRDVQGLQVGYTHFVEMLLYVAFPYAAAGVLLASPMSLVIFAPDSRAGVAILAPWAALQSAATLTLYALATILMVYERLKMLAAMVLAVSAGNAVAIFMAGQLGGYGSTGAMFASAVETSGAALIGLGVAAVSGVYQPRLRLLLQMGLATGIMAMAMIVLLPMVPGPAGAFVVAGMGGLLYVVLTPNIFRLFISRAIPSADRARTSATQA